MPFRKRPPFLFGGVTLPLPLEEALWATLRATNISGDDNYFYEIYLAAGPKVLGDTGAGEKSDLQGGGWLAILAGVPPVLHFYQWNAGRLRFDEVTGGDAPPTVGKVFSLNVRRLSISGDQSARITTVWEKDGQVHVNNYDPTQHAYVDRTPWDGIEPACFLDVSVGVQVPDSDVVVFYLSADRTKLYYRLQREVFETEHLLYSASQALVFDRIRVLYHQYELLISDQYGTKLADALISDIYPFHLSDELGTAQALPPDSGEYVLVVLVKDVGQDTLGSATAFGPDSGVYKVAVIVKDIGQDTLGSALAFGPDSGAYVLVVLVEDLGQEEVASAAAFGPSAGSYFQGIGFNVGQDSLGTATAFGPSGGSYDSA